MQIGRQKHTEIFTNVASLILKTPRELQKLTLQIGETNQKCLKPYQFV